MKQHLNSPPPNSPPPKIGTEGNFKEDWAMVKKLFAKINWAFIGMLLMCSAVWIVFIILTMALINKYY